MKAIGTTQWWVAFDGGQENIPHPLYYAGDANGNITDVLNNTGTLAAHYEYDPFGNTIAQSGDLADANPFRFSSKYWDAEVGVYYYGYRFYSPEVGRWISQDPASERGGLNLYGFVWNAPTRMYDPLGLAPQLCGIDANGMPIYCDDPDPCWGHCPPDDGEPSEPDLSACEGYKQFFGSKCKDKDGCEVDDTYPEDAYNICRSFLEMYDNDASRCVAKCLIGKESGCQGKEKCRDRGLCRVGGHFSCYAGCGFIPWKGFPDGSWDVGSGQLF